MDEDGFISPGELFIVCKGLVSENLSDESLMQIVDKTILYHDKTGNGKINFEEFKLIIENLHVGDKMNITTQEIRDLHGLHTVDERMGKARMPAHPKIDKKIERSNSLSHKNKSPTNSGKSSPKTRSRSGSKSRGLRGKRNRLRSQSMTTLQGRERSESFCDNDLTPDVHTFINVGNLVAEKGEEDDF